MEKYCKTRKNHRQQYGACASHYGYLRLQTYSKYLIFIIFSLQKELHERSSGWRYKYIACLVKYYNVNVNIYNVIYMNFRLYALTDFIYLCLQIKYYCHFRITFLFVFLISSVFLSVRPLIKFLVLSSSNRWRLLYHTKKFLNLIKL